MGLEVMMGSRHLGRFLGDVVSQTDYLREKVEGWVGVMNNMVGGRGHRHLQVAYAGIQNSLQH